MTSEKTRAQDLYTRIVELYEGGLRDQRELAKKLGVSQSTISRYLSQWSRRVPVEDICGRGQPPTFTPSERTVLGRVVAESPFISSSKIAYKMEPLFGKTCSSRTIRNTLVEMSYVNSIPRVVPLLTEAAKEKRVEWACANTERDWSRVFFSDETYIQISANVTRAWHKTGERPSCQRSKFLKKLMFWAAVSSGMKTELFVVGGTMTSQRYIVLLRDEFLPWLRRQKRGQFVFQQDNAPAHTAKTTRQFFDEEKIEVLPWPASSPDLNPIENLWGILKTRVDARKPNDVSELLTAAQEEWAGISLQTVRACINSLPKRLTQVIQRNGNKADY